MCHCTIDALFYFEFEGNFQVRVPGGLYLEGRFNGGLFCVTRFGRLYMWRGLFSEFYGLSKTSNSYWTPSVEPWYNKGQRHWLANMFVIPRTSLYRGSLYRGSTVGYRKLDDTLCFNSTFRRFSQRYTNKIKGSLFWKPAYFQRWEKLDLLS